MAYDWDGTAVGVLEGAREDEMLWEAARRLCDESSIMAVARELQMSGNGVRDAIVRHDPSWRVRQGGSARPARGIVWDGPVRETVGGVDERVPADVTLAEWAAWRLRYGNAGGPAVAAECGCAPSSLYSVLKRRGGVDVLAARAAGKVGDGERRLTPDPSPLLRDTAAETGGGGNGERRLTPGPSPLLRDTAAETGGGGDGERRLTPDPSPLLAQTAGETGGGGNGDGGDADGGVLVLPVGEDAGAVTVGTRVEVAVPIELEDTLAFIDALGLREEFGMFQLGWVAVGAGE